MIDLVVKASLATRRMQSWWRQSLCGTLCSLTEASLVCGALIGPCSSGGKKGGVVVVTGRRC